MLPILKKRLIPIIIQKKQSEGGKILEEAKDDHAEEGIRQAFTEICHAIESGDMDAGAMALKSFFEIVDNDEPAEAEEKE